LALREIHVSVTFVEREELSQTFKPQVDKTNPGTKREYMGTLQPPTIPLFSARFSWETAHLFAQEL
jgi:hypothetical protein